MNLDRYLPVTGQLQITCLVCTILNVHTGLGIATKGTYDLDNEHSDQINISKIKWPMPSQCPQNKCLHGSVPTNERRGSGFQGKGTAQCKDLSGQGTLLTPKTRKCKTVFLMSNCSKSAASHNFNT